MQFQNSLRCKRRDEWNQINVWRRPHLLLEHYPGPVLLAQGSLQRASLRAEQGADIGINLWLDKQKPLQSAGTEVVFVSLI